MHPNRTPDDVRERIIDKFKCGKPIRGIARDEGMPHSTVRKIIRRYENCEKNHRAEPVPATNSKIGDETTLTVNGDKALFEGKTAKIIRSEADAIREFSIDTTRWKVAKMTVKAWNVGMKIGNEKDGYQPHKEQLYAVTLHLELILPQPLLAASDALFERMKSYAPTYPKFVRRKSSDDSTMAVACLFDAHFGKLCWGKETNTDYDLGIAEKVYEHGVSDIVNRIKGETIERFILPVGNDFFHIDNSRNTTYNGTPQDVDGRYARVIETGEMAVIRAVEMMLDTAPVHIIWVPGNHDPTTSFHLSRTLMAWFRSCRDVTVDISPSTRKYLHWKNTLLGFTHGNEEKKSSLPSIMSVEQPQAWANSICREWLCGHEHREKKWQTQPIDTFEGVTVRSLRSLAGTDSWHYKRGYIGTSQSCECYRYDGKGYAGHDVFYARH